MTVLCTYEEDRDLRREREQEDELPYVLHNPAPEHLRIFCAKFMLLEQNSSDSAQN